MSSKTSSCRKLIFIRIALYANSEVIKKEGLPVIYDHTCCRLASLFAIRRFDSHRRSVYHYGYDYYGSTSKVAGPVTPLNSGKTWDSFNLTTSVDYYLANDIPANQLILALPFYGHIWQTETGQKGSRVDHYVGARSIAYIKSVFDKEPSIKQQYDSVSQSAYYTYVEGSSKRN